MNYNYVDTSYLEEKRKEVELETFSVETASLQSQAQSQAQSLTLNDYQRQSHVFGRYPKVAMSLNEGRSVETPWLYPALGLLGEAGELADKLKKVIRDEGGILSSEKREALQLELGDVLWYVTRLAVAFDSTLEDIAKQNILKLSSRAARGKLQGSGDNR